MLERIELCTKGSKDPADGTKKKSSKDSSDFVPNKWWSEYIDKDLTDPFFIDRVVSVAHSSQIHLKLKKLWASKVKFAQQKGPVMNEADKKATR